MEKHTAVPFSQVEITGGFWKERQLINENVTLDCVRKRFEDTGRFDAFKFSWKPGEPNRPHIFMIPMLRKGWSPRLMFSDISEMLSLRRMLIL